VAHGCGECALLVGDSLLFFSLRDKCGNCLATIPLTVLNTAEAPTVCAAIMP